MSVKVKYLFVFVLVLLTLIFFFKKVIKGNNSFIMITETSEEKMNNDYYGSDENDEVEENEEEDDVEKNKLILNFVTENFNNKYPKFIDLFIHYSPIESNIIELDYERSNFKDQQAYYIVDSIYECVKRHYILKFNLDETGRLDDARAYMIEKHPYKKDSKEKANIQVFYMYSNWDCLKISDNFYKKYKCGSSIYEDIDYVNYNKMKVDYIDNKEEDMIIGGELFDKTRFWYYVDFVYDENDYLDDAIMKKINYKGTNIDRAKEAYKKQYE